MNAKGGAAESGVFLAYLDETGNTGRAADPAQPIHMIVCLMVAAQNLQALETALLSIASTRFPAICDDPAFEFHASDIYSGKGLFKGVAVEDRLGATRDVIAAVRRYADAYGYAGVDKTKVTVDEHPHRIAFELLLERIEQWLRNQDDIGLVVSDETNEMQASLERGFASFKRAQLRHASNRGTRLVDTIHFVKSYQSLAIQAADVTAFFRLRSTALRDELQDAYWRSAEPRSPWPDWEDAHTDQSQKATLQLGEEINRIFCFSNKIYP